MKPIPDVPIIRDAAQPFDFARKSRQWFILLLVCLGLLAAMSLFQFALALKALSKPPRTSATQQYRGTINVPKHYATLQRPDDIMATCTSPCRTDVTMMVRLYNHDEAPVAAMVQCRLWYTGGTAPQGVVIPFNPVSARSRVDVVVTTSIPVEHDMVVAVECAADFGTSVITTPRKTFHIQSGF